MTESEINKEAAKFFPPQRYPFGLAFSQDDVVAFAQHCVEKANGWQPIAELTDENLPVWFCQDDRIWVGTKTFDDGWIYTHCHGTHYFNGEFWTCTYAEFDYDYKPTHFQHLPPPPEAA